MKIDSETPFANDNSSGADKTPSTPILNKSLNDIQRAVQDFDIEKGIEEAEKRKALEAL